jgi:hypothetical protein
MFRVWSVVSVCLLAVVVVASASASKGGNSAGVKLCKDEWQSLYRADGSSFVGRGECVSHTAHGETLYGGRLVATAPDPVFCPISADCYWVGEVTGVGLQPGSTVLALFYEGDQSSYFFPVAADGTFSGLAILGANRTSFSVSATDRFGNTIVATAHRGPLVFPS